MNLPSADRDLRQTRARLWMRGLGYVSVVGGVLILALSGAAGVTDAGTRRVGGLITLTVAAVFLVLAKLAVGERAKMIFGVSVGLTGLLAFSNVASVASTGGRGVLGVVIPSITCFHCVKAYRAS